MRTMSADPIADPAPGLRERKKQQTRRHIAETARELFLERGFEAVTVGEIARAADVAEKTVFNYFPTKEDLFYSGMEAFEERLLAAIRDRPAGEGVLAAFRAFVLAPSGVFALQHEEATRRIETITRVITESPALLAREREVLARYTDALAALLAGETGAGPDDIEPAVVAATLLGAHRSLIAYVRRRVLAGVAAPTIADELRAQAEAALDRIEDGLATYAIKR